MRAMSYFLIPCNFFSRLIFYLRSCTDPLLLISNYGPCATNLRSSAFICGLVYAEASYSKDSDRMDRINPSNYPVNPVHPVQYSFSPAPDINCSEFIKVESFQNSSHQSHYIFIHNTFIGLDNTLYIDRIKSSYARGNTYKNLRGKI